MLIVLQIIIYAYPQQLLISFRLLRKKLVIILIQFGCLFNIGLKSEEERSAFLEFMYAQTYRNNQYLESVDDAVMWYTVKRLGNGKMCKS